MSELMKGIDLRTQMVGQNRLELLLFSLGSDQLFGINVFKVKEVVKCPQLTIMPNTQPPLVGIAHMRDQTVSVLNFAEAVGLPSKTDPYEGFVILTEYNNSIQGFLVHGVDRIVNMNWEEIHPPPNGSGGSSYLTAVTEVDNKLIEILDVEKVLSETTAWNFEPSSETLKAAAETLGRRKFHILAVDDSHVARKQIKRTLEQAGLEVSLAKNGREGLEKVKEWAKDGHEALLEKVQAIISDVEMPEMDGYTLTKMLKADPETNILPILMHTSLSGVFDSSMVKKVGADKFLTKFDPDLLTGGVMDLLNEVYGESSSSAVA